MKIKLLLKKTVIACGITLCFNAAFGQGVGINVNGTPPDVSAMLDVFSVNKGILIPRVALQDTKDVTTIEKPARTLLVYNTN